MEHERITQPLGPHAARGLDVPDLIIVNNTMISSGCVSLNCVIISKERIEVTVK